MQRSNLSNWKLSTMPRRGALAEKSGPCLLICGLSSRAMSRMRGRPDVLIDME